MRRRRPPFVLLVAAALAIAGGVPLGNGGAAAAYGGSGPAWDALSHGPLGAVLPATTTAPATPEAHGGGPDPSLHPARIPGAGPSQGRGRRRAAAPAHSLHRALSGADRCRQSCVFRL